MALSDAVRTYGLQTWSAPAKNYLICVLLFESLRLPLTGLTMNAGIYIVAECRSQMLSTENATRRCKLVSMYVRAYNHKITAVLLIVLSTMLGLISLLIDGTSNKFWFSFAVGASGGLLLSVLALIFFMPIVLPLKRQRKTSTN